jgi:hypothetical protein
MGWFWGDSNGSDPTKKLEPDLQDYLEKETPAKYTPTTALSPPHHPPSYPEQREPSYPRPYVQEPDLNDSKPSVPSASLFPDGRYAHIWKDYKPLEEVEGPSISPVEKVVEQFKKRKDSLNRAALENCSEEHVALSLCFKTGDLQDKMRARMTMCRAENRKFSRCYTMQAVRGPVLIDCPESPAYFDAVVRSCAVYIILLMSFGSAC